MQIRKVYLACKVTPTKFAYHTPSEHLHKSLPNRYVIHKYIRIAVISF